jgi:hypothetical protein
MSSTTFAATLRRASPSSWTISRNQFCAFTCASLCNSLTELLGWKIWLQTCTFFFVPDAHQCSSTCRPNVELFLQNDSFGVMWLMSARPCFWLCKKYRRTTVSPRTVSHPHACVRHTIMSSMAHNPGFNDAPRRTRAPDCT